MPAFISAVTYFTIQGEGNFSKTSLAVFGETTRRGIPSPMLFRYSRNNSRLFSKICEKELAPTLGTDKTSSVFAKLGCDVFQITSTLCIKSPGLTGTPFICQILSLSIKISDTLYF